MSCIEWLLDFYHFHTLWFYISILVLVAVIITTLIIFRKYKRKNKNIIQLKTELTSETKSKDSITTVKFKQTEDHSKYQPKFELSKTTGVITETKSKEKPDAVKPKQAEDHSKDQPKQDLKTTPIKIEPIIKKKKVEPQSEVKKHPEPFNKNEPELIPFKRKTESDIVKPIIQNEINNPGNILYTGYEPSNKFSNTTPWTYPMVKFPKKGTVIQQPRTFRRQLRGFMEKAFQNKIEEYFTKLFQVSGESSIPTSASSRPYEPDISIILLKNSLNLFIDVEIDEPYAAIKRNPMHCLNEDDLRDHFFTDRGWIVIRFTEKQIKQHHKKCMAYIANVIQSVYPTFIIPETLRNLPDLPKENQWTALEAQRWEKEKYRETYLGIQSFSPAPLEETNQSLVLSELEKKIESLVKPSVKLVGESAETYEINKRNCHPRDKRIQFISDGHIYLIDGVHARSVTELIDSCFPIYDEEYWSGYIAARDNRTPSDVLEQWKKDGLQSQQLGTFLHQNIEKFFHGKKVEQNSEFQQFMNFYNSNSNLSAYRTEWRIFDEVNLVAGTVDLICKNKDGSFDIYDWKRSKKVVDPQTGDVIKFNRYNQNGVGAFSGLSDTSYSRYCLQQNVYRHILETYYGIKIRNMYLVVMHPLLSNYHKIEVPLISKEVNSLLSRNH